MDVYAALGQPVSEVCNASEVGINGVGCIAVLDKVMLKSINIGR
jgi:hypothetical protein